MRRNVQVSLLVLSLAALLIVGGTMAWFTASADPVGNEFVAGTVEIELIDEFDEEKAQNVNPGDCYDKEISVKNTGTKRAYVRVHLVEKWEGITEGTQTEGVANYVTGENWVAGDEGWYYYKDVLEPDAKTPNLIEEVCFDGETMNNDYQGATFTLTASADAVQATNGAAAASWELNRPDGVEEPEGTKWGEYSGQE